MIDQLGFVVIGRNEGARLAACLGSIVPMVGAAAANRVVYADSGSTDGSTERAKTFGVHVIRLDLALPFTPARGRNEGFTVLRRLYPELRYVQFIDGDCELVKGWCEAALDFLQSRRDVAVVSGRLREVHPERSVYNQLCDIEWNTPVGEALACGGIAMMRAEVFAEMCGFLPHLIGGEEPEFCVRLREKGWKIWRLENEMAVHDAAIFRFGQWWARMVRNGTGFMQVALLHRHSRFGIWKRETARAIVWGGVLPVVIAVGSAIHPAALLMILIYPAQMGRIALGQGARKRLSWLYAFLMTLGKIAEFQGVLRFTSKRLCERWAAGGGKPHGAR